MKRTLKRNVFAGLAALILAASPAVADEHDHTAKHGGKVVESGHHHLEIVAKDGTLEVYVAGEDGTAEDVTGAKATATVLSAGKKSDVQLSGGPGGKLSGTGEFKAAKATVVLTLTMPDHEPEQVRLQLD